MQHISCNCFDPVFVAALGETVCQQCGVVLTAYEYADALEAKARFADEGQAHPDSQVGYPIDELLPTMSMHTCIGGRSQQAARQRLFNKHQQVPYVERALLVAFKDIVAGSCLLGLKESTIASAKNIFATARKAAGVRRGAFFRALPAVCTYFAGKTSHAYRPPDMVCEAFWTTLQDFHKCHKLVLDLLHDVPSHKAMTATVDATLLTSLVLNTLGQELLPVVCHQQIKRIVFRLHDLVQCHAKDIGHWRSLTLVAAEVLVACELHGLDIPCTVIASCAKVAPKTLRRYISRVRGCLPPG